jgi:hypothetical protein
LAPLRRPTTKHGKGFPRTVAVSSNRLSLYYDLINAVSVLFVVFVAVVAAAAIAATAAYRYYYYSSEKKVRLG